MIVLWQINLQARKQSCGTSQPQAEIFHLNNVYSICPLGFVSFRPINFAFLAAQKFSWVLCSHTAAVLSWCASSHPFGQSVISEVRFSIPQVSASSHERKALPVGNNFTCLQFLWGAAEGAVMVQSGEEEAQGRPYCCLQLPERRLWRGGGWPLLTGNSIRTRGPDLKLHLKVAPEDPLVVGLWHPGPTPAIHERRISTIRLLPSSGTSRAIAATLIPTLAVSAQKHCPALKWSSGVKRKTNCLISFSTVCFTVSVLLNRACFFHDLLKIDRPVIISCWKAPFHNTECHKNMINSATANSPTSTEII